MTFLTSSISCEALTWLTVEPGPAVLPLGADEGASELASPFGSRSARE